MFDTENNKLHMIWNRESILWFKHGEWKWKRWYSKKNYTFYRVWQVDIGNENEKDDIIRKILLFTVFDKYIYMEIILNTCIQTNIVHTAVQYYICPNNFWKIILNCVLGIAFN